MRTSLGLDPERDYQACGPGGWRGLDCNRIRTSSIAKGLMTFDHTCAQIRAVTTIKPPHRHVCEDCIKRHSRVHLRTCQECGQTLCCDDSNRHAEEHAHVTGHPVIASAEAGERWLFCCSNDDCAEY
jgi:hypothetical protein